MGHFDDFIAPGATNSFSCWCAKELYESLRQVIVGHSDHFVAPGAMNCFSCVDAGVLVNFVSHSDK